MEQNREVIKLKEDVNNLREIVEKLVILMNKSLIHELYIESKNIESGAYLTEEDFEKRHKVKIH